MGLSFQVQISMSLLKSSTSNTAPLALITLKTTGTLRELYRLGVSIFTRVTGTQITNQ